jgi:radical SAM superfamily enzyme YgiQ (UPF0313 family)
MYFSELNRMRCALVIPSWKREDIFPTKTASSQVNYWQPLGTLYVASSILKAGYDVKFLDGAFMTHGEILNEISNYGPDFVGIYSTTFGWKQAMQTASDVKGRMKHVFIAVGGPYPIAMQEHCLQECASIDAVVTGEGEITVVEVLERLSQSRTLSGVHGIAHRGDSRIIKEPARSLIANLDSLSFPARELLGDANQYIPPAATYKRKPVAVIITSRGCNRRCIFCFQIDKERKSGIRYRSVDNVMQEIELCLRQGYKEIKFIDDTFAADYDRAMQLAHDINAHRLDFTWFASACVDQVDKPLLMAFKNAGCWAILLGAESGVQKNLNTIQKGITLEQTRRAVKAAKEAGLRVFTPFLFGIPGETFEGGLKTIEFACEIDPDVANFHALTPFPGTELYDNVGKYGTMSDDLTEFTYQGAAFVPFSMARQDIANLRQIAFRRFYSRPRFLLRRILALRSFHGMVGALKGLRSLFWLWAKKDIFR